MSTTSTLIKPSYKPNKSKTKHGSIPAKVIVLDSDTISFDTVIKALNKIIPGMSIVKAEQHALEIHTTGSSIVWEGDIELAEAYANQLSKESLDVTVEH